MALVVKPATWPEVQTLFGPSGAYSGCWCMWWRIPSKEFGANSNAGNRAALEDVVCGGEPVGLLAYDEGEPVGWVAVAPRTDYPRLLRSTTLKLQDPQAPRIWSVTCFFIHRQHRRAGVAQALLKAVPKYAKSHGASIVEAYPVAETAPRGAAELFTGTIGLFERAGFTVHDRPAKGKRVVMRRVIR